MEIDVLYWEAKGHNLERHLQTSKEKKKKINKRRRRKHLTETKNTWLYSRCIRFNNEMRTNFLYLQIILELYKRPYKREKKGYKHFKVSEEREREAVF